MPSSRPGTLTIIVLLGEASDLPRGGDCRGVVDPQSASLPNSVLGTEEDRQKASFPTSVSGTEVLESVGVTEEDRQKASSPISVSLASDDDSSKTALREGIHIVRSQRIMRCQEGEIESYEPKNRDIATMQELWTVSK
jgi:hypothetical protein